ncbi:DUF4232 domain-containing protein [Kibdelosporangium phytohabitans]|uniref:DUF4232 domain-containing protein n=1 Tax=Kibdelosporangium phytohabitans TaxID=860235 RepID=A0A0N9HN52_9PSEU|nr:DUF4232 domain-containing protein [Kibdelosporangium phytohabitans]ALG05658.1 hypothetical protein AOZ06_00790 [Kibdelosporangium phytohabitans]MBE1466364.1 hypothetical protein [Kibdelosporangium phytohabitans]
MNVPKIGILAAGSLLLLAACSGTPAPNATPQVPSIESIQPSAPPDSSSAEPSASATPPSASEAPAMTGAPAPVADGLCKASALKITVSGGDGAAGTIYRNLVFTNSSSAPCTIQGFPGVSYVTGDDGHQVGPAAVRVGTKGDAIKLAPGASASAPVGFVQVGNFDPAVCKPTEVRGLRVYPPQETASMFVPLAGTGCAGTPPGQQLSVKTIQNS